MRLNEYLDCNALQLAQRIKSKDVSVHEVLDCALARMHDVNPSLNAVVTDCSDVAKTCLTHLKGDEPYFGVPFLIKDLGHDLQGVRTTEGSRFFAQNIASVTSDLVAKLLMLGFVPIGKTNAAELGLSYVTESAFLGPCRNPYDLNRTPGGSSGGSASAVTAGIVPMATASDGGGSIRIPAACCGLVGFKPTTGVMPVGPWTNEAWSGLATSFVLARSLEDTSALFSTLASAHLAPVDAKQLTIVELEGAFAPVPVDPAYLDAVCHIKTVLTQLGHRIEKKQVHLDRDGIADCMLTLVAANTYMDIAIQEEKVGRRVKKDDIECATMEFYHRGKRLSANDYLLSKNRLYQLIRPLHQLLTPNDVILTPALAQPPLLIGELRTNGPFEEYLLKSTAFSPFTSLFNQAGLPAMTLPVMKHGHLPVSVQMAAAKGNDVLLFSLAKALQPMLPSMTRASYCLGDKGG